jgi:DeoR family transcriptional regulator of aga operon
VSGTNLEETVIGGAMLRNSRQIILVADSSKFSKRSMSRIVPFSEIDIVITDTGLREDIREKLLAMGCNLMLA